jgi:hypothetical protein
MLTLVAAVLAYDMPREMCDIREALSLIVEALEASPRLRRGAFESRRERSWTRLENDMMKLVTQEGSAEEKLRRD